MFRSPDVQITRSPDLPQLQPLVAVRFVASQFPNHQSSRTALRLDPADAVGNCSRHVGFMAGAHPLIALIVRMPPACWKISQEKTGVVIRVLDEAVQHGFYLALGSVGPD